ncbi:MAG: EAL domain-containing protein, partial [Sulfurospirillaceae bacterium]|nr:EAL domain-containing protein [Sulfurospirillaceae bacterium]
RKVVSILFRVEENQTTMKTMQIYGFNIPSNYLALEEMLRTMRLPPFDEKPLLNLWDIWDNYRIFIIIFSNILLFLLGYGLFSLWRKNRQLQESQFLYTKLSEHTNTMHWVVTAEGLYTYVSPNIQALLGYSPQEVIGKLFFYDLCPDDEREIFIQKIYHNFETKGEYYHHERRILKKNGEIAWIAVFGMPILNKKGHLIGYRGSNTDITPRKLAMDSLKESETRFKTLYHASFWGIVIHDQGLILECNLSFSKMGGYTVEELIGEDILTFIAPESHTIVLNHMLTHDEKPYEAVCIRKNKSTFIARIEAKSIHYMGKHVRFVEFRDITDEKKAQENLQLAAKVFETAREAIMITNAQEVIIDVNDAFCLISGYSRDEVIGQTPRILSSQNHTKEFYANMWHDIIHKGHWYGEIWNKHKNGDIYIDLTTITAIRDENNVIQHYISLFSDVTMIKKHEHQLEHIAHHDALTNLPNRLLFADRLNQGMLQAKRGGRSLVVAYLDLDGFKTINDLYGHEIGDQLLITLSSYMKRTLREGDTLARMGGDEFVAVFQDVNSIETTLPMLNRLLEAAATPVMIDALTLQVSASLGITFYPQSEELEADQLLRQADQAMYQAKLAGKNRYHIFDAVQDKNVRDLHENIEQIKRAFDNQEFILYYQPKVNMKTGTLVGVEALIRWDHPERGILPPAVFLPIIENHPLAVDIGTWVINTALSQIEQWIEVGYTIPISVNVGARQLQESNFIEVLRTSLATHPSVKPSLLSLEILETSALEDLARISSLMKECLLLGVHFAMDDFGTGYSSLTYLKQLPLEMLKIDQSFVRNMLEDPDDLSILKGILGLATAFNTKIIAEGVETIEHGEMLLLLGCELAQGYGIARPMPADKIPYWLQTSTSYPSWLEISPIESEHFHLLLAIVKHRAWLRPIENYILGKMTTIHNVPMNQCDFGIWLQTKELSPYNQSHIRAIKQLHQELHILADGLCKLRLNGEHEKALEGLVSLQSLSDTMCDMLRKLSHSKIKLRLKKERKHA